MRVLDLFSGIGGFSLGLERAGMKTAAFCEIEPFCRAVLRKHWPEVPCHEDVRTLPYIGGIDLLCGGFPCQPWSTAGKQLGADDPRHLWPAMLAVIQRERPTWVVGENVPGIIRVGLDPVLADLEAAGYKWRAVIVPAIAFGSPQRRARVWIVAHAERERGRGGEPQRQHAVDADARGQGGRPGRYRAWWATEPAVGRLVNGFPGRLASLRALGNSIVPQIAEEIGRTIMAVEELMP
jgi:DNA (cytosine-5)-methyltransferase 1